MRQRSDNIRPVVSHSALVLVPENRFAHAAAVRLIDPSSTVPIVTLFGPSGVGKTQLARHVAKQAVLQHTDLKIAHVTASELSVELAKASDAKMLDEFQATYRGLQFLVCEDLQAIERRPETQRQLLAIIDTLVAEGHRVLLTSHRPPGELKGLSPKLINRCHGGICAEIELPGPGTRAVLLQTFAEGRGIVLRDQWVQKLAKKIDGTPRELLGAITQLEAMAGAQQTPIDDTIISTFLGRLHESTGPSLRDITKAVAKAFDASPKEIRDGGRGQAVVLPRQVAMYIARYGGEGDVRGRGGRHRYTEIGRYFGGRSHSTVVHACQLIQERIDDDNLFRQQVQQVCDTLQLNHLFRREIVHDL